MFMIRILSAAVLGFVFATSQAAADTIAIVDFQQAINESERGAAAQTQLEAIFQERQASITEIEEQLRTLQTEYQQQAMVLTDEARMAREQEIMQLQQQYQQSAYAAEMEMQQTYGQMMESIIVQLSEVAQAIGEEEGYELIFEVTEGGLVYRGEGVTDITADLVERYDAMEAE